jgi:predicted nucleotidyltransferase component of viral defense system
MTLHDNPELFEQAVLATSQQMNIPEIYVEKDYWVILALKQIFESNIQDEVVFKGGTALSKCHHLINRFSEDIDIVVLKNKGDSSNKLKEKLRKVTKAVNIIIPEVEHEQTNKKGQIRKTVHPYHKFGFQGTFGQVRKHVVVEASWLGSYEPYTIEKVDTYIAQMMRNAGQEHFINEYGLEPFKLKVLSIERTFCEKIMSLVRFSRTPEPYAQLAKKVRHYYDIQLLLQNTEIRKFFESDNFESMLNKVGNDDVESFINNNIWLAEHPKDALAFKSFSDTWNRIKSSYHGEFKDMVIGELPNDERILKALEMMSERLNQIRWDVKINHNNI